MPRADVEAARFATEDDSLAHVLRDRPLEVPVYQRSYSWTTEEVAQYWDDLKAALSVPDPEYFMGTLVLTSGPTGRMTVIDGQQRLATTAILLACFRNYFLSVSDENRAKTIERDYLAGRSLRSGELEPRLRLNRDDADYFVSLVLQTDGTALEPEHESNVRIKEAYDYLTKRVREEVRGAGLNWAELIFRWTEFLEERVKVIVVKVSNDADAFLIFETLNDRGLALTIADLLKNYLFGLAAEELDEVELAWINTASAFDAPADEATLTTFLRHYWGSLHGATRERDLYRRIRSEVRSRQQTKELVHELERSAPNYAALLDSSHTQWKAFPAIGRGDVDSLLRFGLEQHRPLVLAAMDSLTDTELRRLLRALVSWSVRGLIGGGIGGGTTERYYSETAVMIRRDRAKTSEEVFESLAPIILTDEVFQDTFALRRVNNLRLTKYLLLAIDRHRAGHPDPAFVSNAEEAEVGLERVVGRRAVPNDWPEFDPNSLGQWSLWIANAVLIDTTTTLRVSSSTWPDARLQLKGSRFETTRKAAEYDLWTPEVISERQRQLAADVVAVWPRMPG